MSTKPRKDVFNAARAVAGLDEEEESLPAPRARSAPGRLMEFTGVSKELADANKELEQLRRRQASGFEVELDKLRMSPFQIGGLQPARVQALVENLKVNPLSTPIVVRPTSEPGVYEIVGGHHRVEAFRQLGRSTISAVLREMSDDEAERLVFYDNLLAPSLSDYEKYLGFAGRQKSKGLTMEQLAQEAGVSKTTVVRLMAFERLPEQAKELIASNPKAPGLSAKLFQDLAPHSESKAEKVTEAVRRVMTDALPATAALAWVNSTERATPQQAERTLIKRGKHKFAEVRSRGSQWVVTFASEEDANQYGKRLLEIVQEAALKDQA